MWRIKGLAAIALACGMAVTSVPLTAEADDRKYISSISLKVHVELDPGDEIDDGDSIDTSNGGGDGTYVYTSSNKYSIDSAEWATDTTVGVGDTPKIEVYLDPEYSGDTEYRFRSSYSSSSVSISGGTFVSADRKGDQLKVVLRVNGIKGTFSEPEDAYWSDSLGRARWEEGYDSSGYYDVYLYRGSSVVKKLEEYQGNSYNFYPYMTKEGDYTFKVRTVPHTDDEKRYGDKSGWVESGDLYIDADEVSDGTGQDTGSGTGAGGGITEVGWIQDGSTWYFKYPDGTYQQAGWLKWNGKWYLFDSNGRMLTGWQQTNGNWYYLGESGDMKTGWLKSGDVWYYLNPNTDGPEGAMVKSSWLIIDGKAYFMSDSGAMVEGWYQVEGSWYYFYPGQGNKAVNTNISGFQLDENGVWNR